MSNSTIQRIMLFCCLFIFTSITYSAPFMDVDSGLGIVAANVTNSFTALTRLITAGSYIGGLAFFIAAIMKFKQHKDNPTQIPIGTPVALVFIAAALLFFPSVLSTLGITTFTDGGTVAGPSGIIFGQ